MSLSSLLIRHVLIVSSLVGFLPGLAVAQTAKTTQLLNANWRFHQAGKEGWLPAAVPGCVHTDLLASKQIPDPLYRDNELQQQWIGKADWDYETTFAVTPETLRRSRLELGFKGLIPTLR